MQEFYEIYPSKKNPYEKISTDKSVAIEQDYDEIMQAAEQQRIKEQE